MWDSASGVGSGTDKADTANIYYETVTFSPRSSSSTLKSAVADRDFKGFHSCPQKRTVNGF